MEKLVDAVPGVARSRARWDKALIDIWLESDAQEMYDMHCHSCVTSIDVPLDDAIRAAVLRANLTPGEKLR